MTKSQFLRSPSVLLVVGLLAAAPVAGQTFSVRSITASTPDFGEVAAAASGTTTFRISPAGVVSVVSGSGGNIGSASKTAATVTIRCRGRTTCNGAIAHVKIWPTTVVNGRAQAVQNFTVASGSGTTGAVTVNPDGSIQFPFSGFTGAGNLTFTLGLDLPILGDTSSTATTARAQWQAGVAVWPAVPTSPSRTGTAKASVRRALSLTKQSDLSFGAILPPDAGSGTVVIDPASGARSVGSGTPLLVNGLPSGQAQYTAGGQANSAFSISLPASLTMIRSGGGSLNVTLSATASGAQTFDATGAFSFGIGGTVTVPTGALAGDYTGSFVVTAVYN